MALEYDQIIDPWYTHLFRRIHQFLLDTIRRLPSDAPRHALDIGCGTGLQSLILAEAGFDVLAFDLSDGLIKCAQSKIVGWPSWSGASEFEKDMRYFHAEAAAIRGSRQRGNLVFEIGSADDARFYSGKSYGLINCCGSVLSFVEDPDVVLRLVRSALSPAGKFVLEVEMKANLDLLWPLADFFVGGRLGFGQTFSDSLKNAFTLGSIDIEVDYPFELQDGEELVLPMRLFSHRELRKRLNRSGLHAVRKKSIHAVTNIFPSTILHHPLQPTARCLNQVLEAWDSRLDIVWPFSRLGCSGIFELA